MKTSKAMRILSLLLVLVLVGSMLPAEIFAASYTYYQTAKADVPIWSQASSKSTKVRVIGTKGTVVKVTGSTKNSSGNLWYQLTDGNWVYSENVSKHTHDYTGGICKSTGCGYEWPYKEEKASGTYVIAGDDIGVRNRPYSKNSVIQTRYAKGTVVTVVAKTTNQEGNLWYKLSNGYWVYCENVTQQFTITYDANGGTGAPAAQKVLKGQIVQVTSKEPTRTGYTFKGWATSKTANSASHKYGIINFYTFDKDTTLYAVWEACSHSYSGGICDKCGYEYPLSVKSYSGTFVVTESDGAKIWDRPYSNKANHVRTEKKGAVLTVVGKVDNQADNLWYKLSDGNWVYSENVSKQLTVTFDANGGTGGPAPMKVVKGQKVQIPDTKPTRMGYTFKGWAVTKLLDLVAYKPGDTCTFDSSIDMTLYAVWEKCEHKYTGGICDKCGYEYGLKVSNFSGTFVVTNADGAKVWSRPYSNKSTEIRLEKKGAVLTVIAQTTNQEGNIWYKLSDGSWVFSANVTQRYTLTYDTNGGSGNFPDQTVLAGGTVTIHSAKPVKDGYIFKGWATISKPATVECQPGKSYELTGDVKLVAVWEKCEHKYTGGICDKCGYEYPLEITALSATYVVTKSDGALIRPRPYNKAGEVRREAVNAALTVTGKATNQEGNVWYQLSDGNWVYSENVARQYTITYDAKGGTGAPKAQKALSNHSVTISSAEPTKTGYIFQGWCLNSGAATVHAKPGKSYNYDVTQDLTLYAVWKACDHNSGQSAEITAPTCTDEGYTTHTCNACGYSYTDSKVSAAGHSYGGWKVTTKPGCTSAGVERRDCANCDHYQTQEIAATGHSYQSAVTAPTCAAQGYTTHTCASCGHSYKDAYVDAMGHKYESVVTEPTADKQGYTTHTCTVCGESFVDSYVDAKGHSYESVVTAPTCTEQGYTTHTCTDCGSSYVDSYVDAKGHSYESVVTAPTCTEQGCTTHTCTVCGDSYVDSYVDPLPHSYTDDADTTCDNCGFEREPAGTWMLGDVDHSGTVDFFDGMLVLQYYAGILDETGLDVSLADVDNSAAIDFFDGMYILQFYAGIVEKLPVE